MEPIKKLTAALLLVVFTASASTNDFYTVNVYIGGKFKTQWFSPTVPPLNTVVQFNFPQKFSGPAIVDTQVWNSDTPNTLQLWTTEAIFKNGGYVRLTNPPPAIPLTNWFDTIAIGTTNAYQFMTNLTQWCTNVTGRSGTVIALRVALGNVNANGIGLKMALYSSAGTLIASGSTTVGTRDSYTIKTVSVSPRAVQATNIIAFSMNTGGSSTVAIRSPGSAQNNGIKYPAFPPGTLSNVTNNNITYFLSEDLQ